MMDVQTKNGPRAGECVNTQNPATWSLTTATSVRGGCNGFTRSYRRSCPDRYGGVRLMAISKHLRYEILKRDNHTCRYCGATAPDAKLTLDHVLPVTLGGTDDAANLVCACRDCNAGKAGSNPDQPLVVQATNDDMRWADAVKRAAALAWAEAKPRNDYIEKADELWSHWHYGLNLDKDLPRPDNWRTSIGALFDRGLPIELLADSMQRAGNASHVSPYDTWRYFMGICWKQMSKIQDIARAIYLSDLPADGDAE